MDSKAKRKFNLLAIICIIIVGIAITPVSFQNDTFYTVKIGEHIIENGGIDMQDPFSWVGDLKYTYPHWLYDVGTYLIYHLTGWTGVYVSTIILACFLGILLYFVNVKISKNNLISFALTIGAMFLLKPYIAARAQLFTFILFALTIYWIEKFLEKRKIGYAIGLIAIPILIANLHLAVWPFYFILYIPYIAEYLICALVDADIILRIQILWNQILANLEGNNSKKQKRLDKINNIRHQIEQIKMKRQENREHPYKIKMERNKNIKYLILILGICALTGFCTPLGTTPYTYLIDTMHGNSMQNINEHLPLTLFNSKDILCLIIGIIALLMLTDIKVKLRDLFFIGGLIILALMARRQISMFVLIGILPVNRFINAFLEKYDTKQDIQMIAKFLTTIVGSILILSIFLAVGVKMIQKRIDSKEKYISESSYPVAACDYIIENLNLDTMKIYNEYNYGSYMLYRGIPVFIDSRCDLYLPEFNSGVHVFDDFLNISNINTYYEDKFESYEITHVIVYKNAKLNLFLSRDNNYNQLYSDSNFVVYERLSAK